MSINYSEAFAAIGSENFAATSAFYTAILGREPDERLGDGYVGFQLPGLHLGIFKPKAEHAEFFRNPTGRGGGLSLVLRVPNINHAVAAMARLGASHTGDVMAVSHGREVYAYDPDGNRIILIEQTEA